MTSEQVVDGLHKLSLTLKGYAGSYVAAEAADLVQDAARDRRRLDALERAVAESAWRGECVELDGRSPGLVFVSYWRPEDGCLEHTANAPTLAESLDKLADAQEVAGDAGLQG